MYIEMAMKMAASAWPASAFCGINAANVAGESQNKRNMAWQWKWLNETSGVMSINGYIKINGGVKNINVHLVA